MIPRIATVEDEIIVASAAMASPLAKATTTAAADQIAARLPNAPLLKWSKGKLRLPTPQERMQQFDEQLRQQLSQTELVLASGETLAVSEEVINEGHASAQVRFRVHVVLEDEAEDQPSAPSEEAGTQDALLTQQARRGRGKWGDCRRHQSRQLVQRQIGPGLTFTDVDGRLQVYAHGA